MPRWYLSSLNSAAERRQSLGSIVGRNPLGAEILENRSSLLSRLGRAKPIFIGDSESEAADDFVETSADCWIGNAEFGFDILDDAAVLDEDLEEREQIGGQAAEAIEGEVAFDTGATLAASQFGNVELGIADGTLPWCLVDLMVVIVGHVRVSFEIENHGVVESARVGARSVGVGSKMLDLTDTIVKPNIRKVNTIINFINLRIKILRFDVTCHRFARSSGNFPGGRYTSGRYWEAGRAEANPYWRLESGMASFSLGDDVRVVLPRGKSKRGVLGVNVMYSTSQEAKFDGAVGTVTDINPRGPNGIPLFLVDFREHDNSRIGIPWQAQWFREEWIVASKPTKVQTAS